MNVFSGFCKVFQFRLRIQWGPRYMRCRLWGGIVLKFWFGGSVSMACGPLTVSCYNALGSASLCCFCIMLSLQQPTKVLYALINPTTHSFNPNSLINQHLASPWSGLLAEDLLMLMVVSPSPQ